MINLFVLLSSLMFSGSGDDQQAVLLRVVTDAQEANRAQLQIGETAFSVTCRYQRLNKRFEIKGHITWDTNNVLETFSVNDEHGEVLGNRQPVLFNEEQRILISRSDRKLFAYASRAKAATITPYEDYSYEKSLYNLLPPDAGFRCCPPFVASGVLWADLIKGTPAKAQFTRTSTLVKDNAQNIQFRRTDNNGGELVINFAAPFNYNVSSFEYRRHPNDASPTRAGKFNWNRDRQNVWFMTGLSFYDCDQHTNDKDVEYELTYSKTKVFTSLNRAIFNSEKFVRSLPNDTLVRDDINGTKTRTGRSPASNVKDLDGLLSEIKSTGFLNNH
jgi:hypothetical protein